MQWVFDCCESELDEYYWRYSYYDLKKRIELEVGHETAVHMATFASLVEVASKALGGGEKPKHDEDLSQTSPEHFAARVAAMTSL